MNLISTLHTFWLKNSFLIICAFIVVAFTVYHRLDNISYWTTPRFFHCDNSPYIHHPDRFSGYFDTDAQVPDIVHYIRFGSVAECFTEDQVKALISVINHHRPTQIYIHTDNVMSVQNSLSEISNKHSLNYPINVNHYPQPKHVFGLNFSRQHWMKHAVDFTKLKILRRYGGIFLDNNVHVVRNLKKYLNYEMTVVVRPQPSDDIPVDLTDDVIVAHRDARFLHSWLRTYHGYDETQPKHAVSATMKSLLKQNAHYVYRLQYDLPPDLSTGDQEFHTFLQSRKNVFVVTAKDESRCVV